MLSTSRTTVPEVSGVYGTYLDRVGSARAERPLTYAEKILAAHLLPEDLHLLTTVGAKLPLRPDRLAMPDSSAQMALLQFMTSGRPTTALPTTVHCDHLIAARVDGATDLATASDRNREVYDFLESVCARHGIGLWAPGSGIIHQVVLEQYAYPGGLLFGADSHTPNAGGIGMMAIGVGGAQAVDAMVGDPVVISRPRLIGIELTGELSGWASAKDVILRVAEVLTVNGGTGAIIEYFGSGTERLSTTGKATICNMGAEVGATTSIFPFDRAGIDYLRSTNRDEIADLAEAHIEHLRADPEVHADPEHHFDQVVRIDLSELGPRISGPHSPDRGRSIADLAGAVSANGWPVEISEALIGSCTNSSYEDMGRAAHIARQALEAGLRVKTPLLITPGSDQIKETIERDGLLEVFEAIGATVLANACGPCIGQWERPVDTTSSANTIVSSFNRNFPRRNDGSENTLNFLASPEVVIALALAGTLDFDPTVDALPLPNGGELHLAPPAADTLPADGFVESLGGFRTPPDDGRSVPVRISPASERLQLLEPFAPWPDSDYRDLPILLKSAGKTTTDHISPAGPWLAYRGHLDRISDNMFIGVNNAFTEVPGSVVDQRTGGVGSAHEVARAYKADGLPWVVIGDANYGEGSSREHAAMEPRHLGCIAVIARGFARIHETNLKKHGILPLWFADPADYDDIAADDRIDLIGLDSLTPGAPFEVVIRGNRGERRLSVTHTLSAIEIEWFRAGSAMNILRESA